jgi:hypothetical protein
MTRVKHLHDQWLADPAYRQAYEELAGEVEVARAVVEARIKADELGPCA